MEFSIYVMIRDFAAVFLSYQIQSRPTAANNLSQSVPTHLTFYMQIINNMRVYAFDS